MTQEITNLSLWQSNSEKEERWKGNFKYFEYIMIINNYHGEIWNQIIKKWEIFKTKDIQLQATVQEPRHH